METLIETNSFVIKNYFYVNKKIYRYMFIFVSLCLLSWSMIFDLMCKNIDIIYNIMYVLLYLQLIKIKEIKFFNLHEYNQMRKHIIICFILSVVISIIALLCFSFINMNSGMDQINYLYSTNKVLFYLLILFDYTYSYFILFYSFSIYYYKMNQSIKTINKLHSYDIINSPNIIKYISNYSNDIEHINNNICSINGIYITFKLCGLLCVCVTAINIYNNIYNYVNIFDVLLIVMVELMYYFMLNKINYLHKQIICRIYSNDIVSMINNEIPINDYFLLITVLKK